MKAERIEAEKIRKIEGFRDWKTGGQKSEAGRRMTGDGRGMGWMIGGYKTGGQRQMELGIRKAEHGKPFQNSLYPGTISFNNSRVFQDRGYLLVSDC